MGTCTLTISGPREPLVFNLFELEALGGSLDGEFPPRFLGYFNNEGGFGNLEAKLPGPPALGLARDSGCPGHPVLLDRTPLDLSNMGAP